ncbi:MAG: S8 family peptidase [Ardenticatenaceae bacterium]|nr:S8 family peptidase [Ardenticatenaceae bacterium]MCB8991127.1 S8 family peptidase [Ardenticatenaceae bacterium]MCB9005283.1 S8 family peptidase [Ardenticatenaceae bacterium]
MSAPASAELRQLGVEALWRQGLSGQGVGVGHLDSGVAPHPALHGRITRFLHINENGRAQPNTPPFDSGKHGTHTAGLICGGAAEGTAVGVAPQANLYSAAVIDGGHTILRILRGLCWLAEQPVRVTNLPLGIPAHHPVFREAIAALRQRGILPIAAIGNRGAGRFHSPGGYDNVLSVGATNGSGQVASFCGSRNTPQTLIALKPDVLAPGRSIRSLHPNGRTQSLTGTSMSSATVAGIAALLFEACPAASVRQVEMALINATQPVETAVPHRSRAGLVNAPAALAYLQAGYAPDEPPQEIEDGRFNGRFLDPHLRHQFFYKGETAVLPAIIGVSGAFGEIAAAISTQVGEAPAASETLPPTSLTLVHASVRWLQTLLTHPAVTLASAVDVDLTAVLF